MAEKIYEGTFRTAPSTIDRCADFIAIVKQLRRDCPWDREQTHDSIKHLLIEECFETVEAIDNKDWDDLKRELGDLLLHVVFNAVIAEQNGTFTLDDVIDAETDKLVRRHPHVFGDTNVSGTKEVLRNWEKIKMAEGKRSSVLDGVPIQMPALLHAFRIQEKAAGVGFDFSTPREAWTKVDEELEEFRTAENDHNSDRAEEELGDLLFAIVNYSRLMGWNPENALRMTNKKFMKRFRHIEETASSGGKSLEDMSLVEMDAIWDDAKQSEN